MQDMATARRFSGPELEELALAKIIGVRAGTEHRYTGVWVVVVEGRVFVRSWNDKTTGWYRAFQAQPLGSIQFAGREIGVRARRLRGERLRDAVTRAYAAKYNTKASKKWVCGFAEPHRSATTLELSPVQPSPAPECQARLSLPPQACGLAESDEGASASSTVKKRFSPIRPRIS
jgi:hypothetical protein